MMLATISPASIHMDESLATLRYACQARCIVNRIRVNESEKDQIIRELQAEVNRLKSLHYDLERQRLNQSSEIEQRKLSILGSSSTNEKRVSSKFPSEDVEKKKSAEEVGKENNRSPTMDIVDHVTKIERLSYRMTVEMQEIKTSQKLFHESLVEAQMSQKNDLQLLKKNGLAVQWRDNEQHACLFNLSDDPLLSGALFYMLPYGRVRIGRKSFRPGDSIRWNMVATPDIILEAPLIGRLHW